MIDPEYELSDVERATLVSWVNSAGIHIFKKIMEAEASKFNVALLNTDPVKDGREAIVDRHYLAKAAAQYHTQVWNRVNKELHIFTLKESFDKEKILIDNSVEELGGE